MFTARGASLRIHALVELVTYMIHVLKVYAITHLVVNKTCVVIVEFASSSRCPGDKYTNITYTW